jgi:DNA-binding IclR family transcriptional regulator
MEESGEHASDGSIVRSLEKGLLILDSFIKNHIQSLNQISSNLDMPKSTTHRMLATLCSRGYIVGVHGENGVYKIGSKGLWFTSARTRVHELLEGLRKLTGETANVGVIVGNEIEFIDRAVSDYALRWGVDIGSRIETYCSGMGKAVLAYRPELVPNETAFVRKTGRTISSLVELRAQFEVIRFHGFAIDDEEFIAGVLCIASPIRDESGDVVGAISISGPKVRFTKDVALSFSNDLVRAAANVSKAFGFVASSIDG